MNKLKSFLNTHSVEAQRINFDRLRRERPLDNWERLRIKEIKEGGNPTVCIMGCDDYASFCGAVQALHGIETFGHSGYVKYYGIQIFRSRSKRTGTMFA